MTYKRRNYSTRCKVKRNNGENFDMVKETRKTTNVKYGN